MSIFLFQQQAAAASILLLLAILFSGIVATLSVRELYLLRERKQLEAHAAQIRALLDEGATRSSGISRSSVRRADQRYLSLFSDNKRVRDVHLSKKIDLKTKGFPLRFFSGLLSSPASIEISSENFYCYISVSLRARNKTRCGKLN